MLRKQASASVLEAWRVPAGASADGIRKAAHRVAFEYEPRKGYIYVRARMISSRTNDNHDTFPAEEIEKGYKTFLGKPAFVNHHNANHRRARGVIVAVALHRDVNPDGTPDTWVEGLHEIDAVRFPKLARAIIEGRVNRTSMGVDVEWSTCSACGNKATSPAEYCRHLPAMKGKKIRKRNPATGKLEERLIHEVCAGLSFFENSLLVEDPADSTAYILDKPDARGLEKAAAREPDFREYMGNHCLDCGEPVRYTTRLPCGWRHLSPVSAYDHDARPSDPDDRSRVTMPLVYGGTHCVHCGDPVRINVRKLDVNGGWHHADGNRRPDHEATPADPQAVHDAIPGQRARLDQAREEVRQHLHRQFEQLSGHPLPQRPRGDEDRMPPDPFTAARRRRKKPRQDRKPVKGYGNDPRFDGVGLHRDNRGYFVHTHRERSDSYPSPDDIPDDEVGRIRATGAARKERAAPGDHPWFRAHPVSAAHVLDAWHDSTDEEKHLGRRWYSDAHHVAKAIASGDAALGAGLLSAYSPQTAWPVNLFNASRAMTGDPPGPGTGAMGMQQRAAMRMLAGEHHSQVLRAPKTAAFAHLIEHGGDTAEDEKNGHSRVVVDRHALSVATGRRLSKEEVSGAPLDKPHHYEHVAQAYREAAHILTKATGKKVSAHQVQAVTWLRQVRRNKAEDSASKGGEGKGRVKMQDNARPRWEHHHRLHHPEAIEPRNMHYHGSWQEEAPSCAACGNRLAPVEDVDAGTAPGAWPRSAMAPHLCADCAAAPVADRFPGFRAPWEAPDLVRGGGGYRPWGRGDAVRQSASSLRREAYGETRVPSQVDTLRMEECPVCGEREVWSGDRCPVCGFIVPPSMFRDPDLTKAHQVREQLDQQGEVDLGPDGEQVPPGEEGVPGQADKEGLPPGEEEAKEEGEPEEEDEEEIGSGDDADAQLLHPDQLAPDGVPAVQDDGQGNFPEEEDEEALEGMLACPACGEEFEPDLAAQPGVPCPACGQGDLEPAGGPPEGAEAEAEAEEEAEDEAGDEEEDEDMPPARKTGAQQRTAALVAENEVLREQLSWLSRAAGVEPQMARIRQAVLQRHADILNPASPVPDPPEAPAPETTEQALQPAAMDDPSRPGSTPGANSGVAAQQTTTAITPGVEMQTPPATMLTDVTAPVQGTNPSQDGGVPISERRIESDVRVRPDMLAASGPGIGGSGTNGTAFPWLLGDGGAPGGQPSQPQQRQGSVQHDEASAAARTFASIRLAQLRVQAGLEQGDPLAVAERIERDAALSGPVIEHEIGTLSRIAMQRGPQRPMQRAAARQAPSLASVGASQHHYAPAAADDDLDGSDLFL